MVICGVCGAYDESSYSAQEVHYVFAMLRPVPCLGLHHAGEKEKPAAMPPVTLRRIDPAKHVSRFYRLDVQPDLFGQWSLVREWGRIGSAGTLLVQSFPTQAEAEAAATHVRRLKERKGYHDIAEQET